MDNAQAQARLDSEDNFLNKLKISHTRNINGAGRRAGVENIPDEVKELVALSVIGGDVLQKDAAEAYGISKVTVNQLAKGNDYKGKHSPVLTEKIEKARSVVESKATSKVLMALGLITQEKLSELDISKIAKVASDLSSVSERMREKKDQGTNVAQVIIYAPTVRTEQEYQTIEIKR